MKWSLKAFAVLLAVLTPVWALRAELPMWAQETIAFTPLEGALFRMMGMPDGTVRHARPAWEARDQLGGLIGKSPHDAGLYALRAHEEERMADFGAAEADLKQAAAEAQDKLDALGELADFYHRRVEAGAEVSVLLQLGSVAVQPAERFEPAVEQAQWKAFIRAIEVSREAQLPAARWTQIYDARIHRYPAEASAYQGYLDWAIERGDRTAAGAIAARVKAAFPGDVQLAITTDAKLARVEKGVDAALAVYSKNFSPLWPEGLRTKYFEELTAAHELRTFLAEAQAAGEADPAGVQPAGITPALRIFFYYEQEGRKDIADARLLRLVAARASRKVEWSAAELKTVAALLGRVGDYDESANLYYSLYELPSGTAADKQLALAALIGMLLDIPERALDFGNRDLSVYRNIARMDRHPGFLNGILSLALNDSNPEFQYQNASQTAVAYFHRASASRLMDQMKAQFPRSVQTPQLEAKLFSAYAAYGQEDAILRAVPAWLNRNRNASEYVSTALLLADAYEAKRNVPAELALYDRLLTELAARSGHMPIGPGGVIADGGKRNAVAGGGRSPDYSRALDRYISRLTQLGRGMDALVVFRREIEHNPDDAGIYERLALFLEQNRLDSDLERTYRDAMNHFRDMTWASKLGRFYVARRQADAYAQLAHEITDSFKGSEMAVFLAHAGTTSPVLFRQVNLYAHERFPYNLQFVRNLLAAYRAKATRDDSAYEQLLRENWFYDAELKNRYFELLSASGRLRAELAALPDVDRSVKDGNLAALEMRANGEAWLTNYEAAGPVYARMAALMPGDVAVTGSAITVERSLGAKEPGAFKVAIGLAEQAAKSEPGNLDAVRRVGEIYADREDYAQARVWWNRVAAIRPGTAAGYLDTATVFWDYFQFNDVLRTIAEGRRKLAQPALFSYEAGAIYESQGQLKHAVEAYVAAALREGSEPAKERLLTLARRKATAALVDEETAGITNGAFNSAEFELRLALLEKLDRLNEIQSMLRALLPRATRTSEVEEISGVAVRLGFDDVAAGCMRRIVAMTPDPIEKIQARLALARFFEGHGDVGAAAREFGSVLKDEPNRLGVVRAAVDFEWRQKQWQAAVTALEEAADRAQGPYPDAFRREAAEKATAAGLYAEARRLLDQLLSKDPYNGDLLAQQALTYARQNDTAGLIQFYSGQLNALQAAVLGGQDKTARIAGLRRGYILALTAGGSYREAMEQYQLLINAYPEDGPLAAEAARYADGHQLAQPLIAYYQKATSDSPRNYRWPLVLARVQTALRHYPEAIAAYEAAAHVRPDRSDLFLAKADLETRLLRFDDAIKSYGKLYELNFHDVQYLGDQAELYARLSDKAQTMRLLREAYIAPHPREPGGYVSAMQHLAGWQMYAEEDALFAEVRPMLTVNSPWNQTAVTLEAQALVALHRPVDAMKTIAGSVAKPADAAVFTRGLAEPVGSRLEPGERATLAATIEAGNPLPGLDLVSFGQVAGLPGIQAAELARQAKIAGSYAWQALDQLQSSRLLFDTLGQQLEEIARTANDTPVAESVLSAAFEAYAKAEDTAGEMRLARNGGREFPRLFVLAGGNVSERVAALAATNPERANQVVHYIIKNEAGPEAVGAISARGRRLTPLWTNSYTALEAVYSLSTEGWAERAFRATLGPDTVGGELAAGASEFLRGGNWFYYAARYGDYLGYLKKPEARDYLAASLEANPAASNSYVQLAESMADLHETERAAALYRQGLQLSPERADIYDRLALLALAGGQRGEAIDDWRQALTLLTARIEKGPLQPEYWTTAQNVLAHVNRARAMDELKAAADAMLRTYARRNGTYQFEPFLAGIFDHPQDRRAALDWVLDLARIPEMAGLTDLVLNARDWVTPADKEPLYRAQLERLRRTAQAAAGDAAVAARSEVNRKLNDYAQYLQEQKRWADEWNVLQQIQPAAEVRTDLLLEAAALSGHWPDLLTEYESKKDAAPAGEQVLEAAASLRASGHDDFARQLREYEYGRELAAGDSSAAAWFGMAEVRFDQKRNEEGLALIRSVTLSVGAPFENLAEAVHVLDRRGLAAEAASYALEWRTAEPWNGEAQLAYARLKKDLQLLDSVRRQRLAAYSTRVDAARAMRELGEPVTGSDELALLTRKTITVDEASQAFYVQARVDAARQNPDPALRTKLYQEAIALDPSLNDVRLQLAGSAFAAGRAALGLEAFESYRNPPGEDSKATPDYVAVEKQAAPAAAGRGDWGRALQFYGDLLQRVHDPGLTKARDEAREKQRLAIANEARAPRVSGDVMQPKVVKPKLTSLPVDLVVSEEPVAVGEQ